METNNKINRRDFLKVLGTSTAAVSTAVYVKGVESTPSGVQSLLAPEDGSAMTMRTGVHGDQVSLLGYGGMRWPTKQGEGRHGVIDQDKVNTLIDYAMKHGVNYYDTAPVYHGGQSEKAMGIALNRHPRETWKIATKQSNSRPNQWNLEFAKGMYENSFKQLGVEYIDYYLLHNIGPGAENFEKRFINNGILDFLVEEREKGRIKNLGWSFHGNRESFLRALNQDVKWDFVQIQMNYYDWVQDSDDRPSAQFMYEELDKRGIPVVVMEPLLGGRLATLNDQLLAQLKKRDAEQTPASWAFRFVGSHPRILTALSGMTFMNHLEEDVKIFSPLKPLTEDEENFLQETAVAMMKYPTVPCTACKYCMPCPFGLDIPANFAFLNKCIEDGNIPASRQSANYQAARKNFLKSFSKKVSTKKQSLNCTSCNHCVPLCPQHIEIPKQMARINDIVNKLKNNTL